MEQKLPVMAKKVWSLIRVMFSMLKKGISKTKFFAVIKRGNIAGKALHNLLFHHHHNWVSPTSHNHLHHLPSGEHEFMSCSNTPPNSVSLFSTLKNQNKYLSIPSTHVSPCVDDIDNICVDSELLKALDMLTTTASPAMLGSRKSHMVKQLRITDSPFPVSNDDEDAEVDEAAEKFIMRFYNGLRRQN
ncbi:unnamed protein product [Lactuca saligna]|uniref:Avr9/Cf-9 rapidly elicited protein 146 n=1 Tax=Lactuca saligna TaxID=75948 RepID=A0AA35YCA9_LACSI|nr:unnamed protein product [Lactuca saligna]